MNKYILNIEVQDFIRNYSEDISKLAFSGSPFDNTTTIELSQQIESRRKIEKKLPSWYAQDRIYYPLKLNLEQTSSEKTAKYKASLLSGRSIADITGGFGVDSFYFSEKFEIVHYFEHNRELSEIAAHNFEILSKKNIVCIAGEGIEAIQKEHFDVIFADPSRRHGSKGKVFFLNDCEPNIPDNIKTLLSQCDFLLLKTSPMLDISAGLNELGSVSQIHIVAIENEVKELLWLLNKTHSGAPKICTINMTKVKDEILNFKFDAQSEPVFASPQRFLYEPNAAIMKSGAFDLLCEVFNLNKLHKNTHLYTNDTLVEFPGRRFSIEKVIPYSKAGIRKLGIKKANVTVRNFPESVADLRKKWKIMDGGDLYLFFTTLEVDQKVILLCSRDL